MSISVEKLKNLRRHHGWSQERLAEISDLSLRTIQRIENGDNASLESQLAIASAFNVSPSELLEDQKVTVGNGGINSSGIFGLLLGVVLMALQFYLGGPVFFDFISILLVDGLMGAMAIISLGVNETSRAVFALRWVFVLPKDETHIPNILPSLYKLINYAYAAGAISTLVGIIAVFMSSPESMESAEVAANPTLYGLGIALLTLLYASMVAELVIRPLKHRLERMLILQK